MFIKRSVIVRNFFYTIFALCFTFTVANAYGDFFGFNNDMAHRSGMYRYDMNREINSAIDEMNRNNWSNPYETYNNPISKIFKKRESYSSNPLNESDIDYLLKKMEKRSFGKIYTNLPTETRIDRLDSQMFGAIQTGDFKTRLNRLKHAYSAESTRNYKEKDRKQNRFREFFSSGYPTSIPARGDYYSSLRDDFQSW